MKHSKFGACAGSGSIVLIEYCGYIDRFLQHPMFFYTADMDSIRNSVVQLAGRILADLEEPERVQAAWPLAAGSGVARRTRAVSFSVGSLTVAVPDKAWQQQLAVLRPQLRAHLTRITGVAVADILFFVETKTV